jgi:Fe-S cluster biogenesis protein NfuA
MKTVEISLEFTPNPNTLKYVIDQQLLERGAAHFKSAADAERSPLAKRLFGVTGVAAVMIGRNFVTVTKGEQGDWENLNKGVTDILKDHLGKGLTVIDQAALAAITATRGSGEVEKRIREILDEEIRPAVARDGGDIVFDRYENGVVYVHLQGACRGCPGATATLKMGVEARLKDEIPEIEEVVSV